MRSPLELPTVAGLAFLVQAGGPGSTFHRE